MMSARRTPQILDFGKHRQGLSSQIAGPVSRANLLGGNSDWVRPRNAGLRSEAWHSPDVFRADFPARWSRFIRRCFASRDAVQIFFCVSFQTACNWWDAAPFCAGGAYVTIGALAFPAVFFEVMDGDGGQRRPDHRDGERRAA